MLYRYRTVLWFSFLAWALAASLAAEENYRLKFNVYPPDAQWFVVSGQPGNERASRTELYVTVNPPTPMRVAFTHDWFESNFVYIDPSQIGRHPQLDAQGYVVYPSNNQIVLKPKNKLLGALYLLSFYWRGCAVLLLLIGGALSYARRRHGQMQKLREENWRRRQLAELARSQDDPLVRSQKTLGPYTIIDKLGEGGMAAVYKAVPTESLDLGEAVAIKVMKAELTREEDRRRFLREIQVVQELHHPNIVRLDDYGETEMHELFMVMELVDGVQLSERLSDQGLTLEEVSALLKPLLLALCYAHEHGVVHRDIKPQNILITQRGVVKVMDFGLARTHEAARVTKTGTMVGSPAYCPPEQLTGGLLDPRSDQYSLGITLYEMLAGALPFPRSDTMAVLMAHMVEQPPRCGRGGLICHHPLSDWCCVCWRKIPTHAMPI